MVNAEIVRSRGYTELQLEANRAHLERQQRMGNARVSQPLPMPPPPKPRPFSPAPRRRPSVDVEPIITGEAADGPVEAPLRVKCAIIQTVICEEFKITLAEILSSQRAARIVEPRQIAFFIAARLSLTSLPAIGLRFSKDHSTVLHGRNKIARMIEFHPAIRDLVEDLQDKCLDAAAFEAGTCPK